MKFIEIKNKTIYSPDLDPDTYMHNAITITFHMWNKTATVQPIHIAHALKPQPSPGFHTLIYYLIPLNHLDIAK